MTETKVTTETLDQIIFCLDTYLGNVAQAISEIGKTKTIKLCCKMLTVNDVFTPKELALEFYTYTQVLIPYEKLLHLGEE